MKRKGIANKRLIEMMVVGVLLLLSALPISSANQLQPSDPISTDALQNANPGNGLVGAPNKATLVSPSGIIDTGRPTYIWSSVQGSTFYCLKVNSSTGNTVINQCYKGADLVPVAGLISVTPSVTLEAGDYKWRIQTWNSSGSNWSNEMLFTVCTSTSFPGRTTLISPKGTIGPNKPTYTWYAVSDATKYHLKVINIANPSPPVIDQWITSTDVVSDQICSIKPDVGLVAGSYRWWVQTGNCLGDGLWSNYESFRVTATKPGKASPISPRGLISTRDPTYIWTAAPLAAEYFLQIENDTAILFSDTYPAEEVTVGNRCRLASPITLPLDDSDFYWQVQAINDAGAGPMSNYVWFEPVCSGNSKKDLARAMGRP